MMALQLNDDGVCCKAYSNIYKAMINAQSIYMFLSVLFAWLLCTKDLKLSLIRKFIWGIISPKIERKTVFTVNILN